MELVRVTEYSSMGGEVWDCISLVRLRVFKGDLQVWIPGMMWWSGWIWISYMCVATPECYII